MIALLVNKKSGTAHVRRDGEALNGVPEGALRVAQIESGSYPPFKLCRYCFPFLMPSDSPEHSPSS